MSKQSVTRGRLRRLTLRALRLFSCPFVALVAIVLVQGWTAFGQRATGARLLRMQGSPQFHDGHFVNPQPLYNDFWGSAGTWRRSRSKSCRSSTRC